MNIVNEIGNDVARAFLIDKSGGDRIDPSRARELMDTIRRELRAIKESQTPRFKHSKKLAGNTSQ
jgi:hypothetical protein